MKIFRLIPLAMAGALALTGCNNDNDNTPAAAQMRVLLVDAPGDYKAVNIDLKNVQVNVTGTNGEDGWQTLDQVAATRYNLLDYVNGRAAVIAGSTFPAGHIEQIRLVLGDNNTLTLKDGTTVALKTPSGQTSGLKVKLNTNLEEGVTYNIVLDFDVAKSIVARGNGEYNLKPVIRAVAMAAAGAIRGTVDPAAAHPQVLAIRTAGGAADTLSTYPDNDGGFLIPGVSAGTYRVEFRAGEPYENVDKPDVQVTNDHTTDLGVISLN
ncbi:hypothetical protein PK28_01775 [Hymenobacter sp. DG25B]|uniref:DUF4382 domain-containing protein n=1 Tax=Hymenobacter sp. DG25B TaxID=1385664 RepID=UPI0005410078|nr:DUF4382 domain-containing protein [Hymenobacter sp. DG25B]AIZ62726.1 hypothetical protein PK28_01775 [Hymenobacter sp. DG25B]